MGYDGDHHAGAGAGKGDHDHLLTCGAQRLEKSSRRHGGLFLEEADREGGGDGSHGGDEDRIPVDEHCDQADQRRQQIDVLDDNGQGDRHLFFFEPLEVLLDRNEVNPDDQAGVVEQRLQGGRDAEFQVRDAGDFRHDERSGTHNRRHVLPAAGGDSLDRPGEVGSKTEPFHHGNGEGTGGIDIRGRHAADGSEKGAADHRYLGGPSPAFPGQPAGQIGKEFPGFRALHEGPEDDKKGDKSGGNTCDGAVYTRIGEQKLHLDEFGQGQGFGKEDTAEIRRDVKVSQKCRDQDGHGRHHGSPDRLEQQQDIQNTQDHFHR